ncbi:MAG: ABC transporter permease [Propionicimonas sp.]
MSPLDLSPAAAPAPRARRVLRHAAMEARLTVRNGEQLLLALVIPIGLLVADAALGDRFGLTGAAFPASVLALGLWSTGFTSLAITTGFERRYGVLERLVATPLRSSDLLIGKALSISVVATGQALVLSAIALATGWAPHPTPGQSLVVALAVPLGLIAFAGLALILSGRASAELTLALSNLVYLAGAAAGVLLPPALYPAWAQPLVGLLPTTALAESLRAWAEGRTDPLPLLILLGWAVAGLALARRVFRWTS